MLRSSYITEYYDKNKTFKNQEGVGREDEAFGDDRSQKLFEGGRHTN